MNRISLSDEVQALGLNPVPLFFESTAPIKKSPELLITATLAALMKNGPYKKGYGAYQVDAKFLANLNQIQELLCGWWSSYQAVDLGLLQSNEGDLVPNQAVGCFFSAGVDSFYTFLQNQNDITHLVYVHGFDIPLENEVLFQKVVSQLREVAQEFKVELILVRTNLRLLYELNDLEWGKEAFGSALAAVAHLFGDFFRTMYVPASLDAQSLMPWGSHPKLDPLWSASYLELVHHGSVPRTEKIRAIVNHPLVLAQLRVCFLNPDNRYNCCRCEKCLRTMVTLHALGKLEQCSSFHERLSHRRVRKLWITSQAARVFVEENIALLEETEKDPKLAEILKGLLERPQWLLNTYLFLRRKKNRFLSVLRYLLEKIKPF